MTLTERLADVERRHADHVQLRDRAHDAFKVVVLDLIGLEAQILLLRELIEAEQPPADVT